MAKRVSVDRWLFTVTMLLVFVGLVMVFSASAVDGAGALRVSLCFSVEAVDLGGGGHCGDGGRHARRLPALQASGSSIFVSRRHYTVIDFRFFSRPLA